MSMRTFVFVGVGGQGALTAARFLGDAIFRKGIDVNVSQLHGMSVRGGTVHATVIMNGALGRASDSIDVLIGFDMLEACRVASRICADTVALCNANVVPLPAAALRRLPVPDITALSSTVLERAGTTHFVGATELARVAGRWSTLNIVMLGALSRLPVCPVSDAELLASVLELSSPRAREQNARAFELGRDAIPEAPR